MEKVYFESGIQKKQTALIFFFIKSVNIIIKAKA